MGARVWLWAVALSCVGALFFGWLALSGAGPLAIGQGISAPAGVIATAEPSFGELEKDSDSRPAAPSDVASAQSSDEPAAVQEQEQGAEGPETEDEGGEGRDTDAEGEPEVASSQGIEIPAREMRDLSGTPQRVSLSCGDEQLASSSLAPGYYSLKGGASVWEPSRGQAEWLAVENAPLPGSRSSVPAMITGHVRYSGEPDVFWRLGEVTPGCLVEVTYDSGDRAVFEIVTFPESIDKSQFPSNDEYWTLPEPGRALTVVTCDKQADLRSDGHLSNNIAVRAVRVG